MNGKEPLNFKHMECVERAPYHYTACGLSDVYLYGGYEEEEFDGECYVSIQHVNELHRAIMGALVSRPGDLSGEEVRFLRKEMDLTQAELATLVGVRAQTVARWEKDETEIPGPANVLLRLLTLGHLAGAVDVVQVAQELSGHDETRQKSMALRYKAGQGWTPRQAA